ncbi:anti-repressor Ant [Mycobacterium phage Phayonce]|uniref:Antirepressor n=1 Tax=Mycobacterium phage Phayonce TaxID=1647302 RepID=A0A0F6WE01_9CAUD|nr:anti-repressor Ant [Mycobacterium phage Phayonce]AKF14396.1 antirepressor [Mycobacterium phage Phayonce]
MSAAFTPDGLGAELTPKGDVAEAFAFDGHVVRVLLIDGDPWFVAGDVARALGYRDAHNLGRRLDEDEKGTHSLSTPGGTQNAGVISESGLYTAILGSQVHRVREFKRWVTREVLPAIRNTGSYSHYPAAPATAALPSKRELAQWVIEAEDRAERAEAKVAALEPKAEFYDELMDADGAYSLLATAKILGWGRNVMMRELRRAGVLQGNNLPYQRYAHHFRVVPGTYENRKTGETVPTATTTVLPSGIAFLRRKLDAANPLVEVEAVCHV